METWNREMVFFASASRLDVKYSLTEKCANWITEDPSTLTTASKLEHVDNTACTGSSGRHSARNVGVDPSSKSNARNSASSLTRSGRDATATHWNRRCANSQFWPPISSSVRAYVSARVSDKSSRAHRIHPRRQWRRWAS